MADKLKTELEKQTAIGSVWIRSIDAAAISVIECESRLNAPDLVKVVTSILPEFNADRTEKRYLSFRKGSVKQEIEASSGTAEGGKEGGPLWEIIVGVAVSAIGGAGAFIMKVIKRKVGV